MSSRTFLFTDIEGSTRLWEHYPREMQQALRQHDALLRQEIEAHGGQVFKTIGDAFCAVFEAPLPAVHAAAALQTALHAQPLMEVAPLRVRAALHTGPAEARDHDYFGQTLNRTARLLAVAHGGQTLVSQATQAALPPLLAPLSLLDLGSHTLKDLDRPEPLYQLCAPSLPPAFPPLRTEHAPISLLPVPTSPLIGRERELAELLERLTQTRLLTLLGTVGTGKTRLALEVAHRVQESTAFGLVLFLPLEEEPSPERIWPLLAQQLDRLGFVLPSPLPGAGAEDTARRVLTVLRGRNTLLCLDSLEHLDSAELLPLLRLFLEQTTTVRLLVTTQRGLNLRGEQVYPLTPLALPSPDERPEASPSVQLFVERAKLLRPEFAPTADQLDAISALCQRLDGLPLAIEMAAARVSVLSPAQILDRLESRTDLLLSRSKDVPTRHLSLRAALEWSYELLSPDAQRFLQEVSVFRGGWTFEAAEQVCTGDVLETSEELHSASLLLTDDGPQPRYRLLEVIRSFARAQLSATTATQLRQRHADWCLALLARQEISLPERENLLAAMQFLNETGQVVPLATLLHSQLGHWWALSGFDEARQQLGAYLETCIAQGITGKEPLTLLAHLLHMELYQQRLSAATAWLERADAFVPAAEREGDADWCLVLAHWADKCGAFEKALTLHQACERHATTPGHLRRHARNSQIWMHLRLGHATEAESLCRDALDHPFSPEPDIGNEATLRFLRASALTFLGDLTSARAELDKSLALLEALNHTAVLRIGRSIEVEWLVAARRDDEAWKAGVSCLLGLWKQRDIGRVLAVLNALTEAAVGLEEPLLARRCAGLARTLESVLPYKTTAFEQARLGMLGVEPLPPVGLAAMEEQLRELLTAL